MLYKFLHKIILAACFFAISACEKEVECPVPGVEYFDFQVNLESLMSMTTIEIAGYGYQRHGIIIYRHVYEYQVSAFDATCVDNADCLERGKVRHSKENDSQGKCIRCSAVYNFTDGMHTQKKVRLRAYSITPVDNSNILWRLSNR
ncbi:hypothetical protein FACS189452_09460 [Bacteroidia bacterium]|nr:hypothetical protein FACS189452_09460 [Bacteroidia bacterium]GHT80506.1 hypothetical protein FACS189467_2830 [Bacteroidia bacterium]